MAFIEKSLINIESIRTYHSLKLRFLELLCPDTNSLFYDKCHTRAYPEIFLGTGFEIVLYGRKNLEGFFS